jgi:hypothetical protein
MPYNVWQRNAVTEAGDVIPLAEVEVFHAGQATKPDIYSSDSGGALTNPFDADVSGFIQFFTISGFYDIAINGAVLWENIQIGDGNYDNVAQIALSAPRAGDSATTKGCLTVGDGGHGKFIASATAVGPVNGYSCIEAANGLYWNLLPVNGAFNVLQFGNDVVLAVNRAKATNSTLLLTADAEVDGEEITIDAPMTFRGDGRGSHKITFTGSPAKTVRTYATWRAEYDAGNYSASSDAAIACGIRITSTNVFIRDIEIEAEWNPSTNYPLPFDSATDYPTSEYDFGILVQAADVSFHSVRVTGPWGTGGVTGGLAIDCTQPGGAPEHIKIHDSELHGTFGLLVLGPHGAGTAPNYSEMVFADVRGAGGVSDLEVVGTQIYDSQLRLIIDGSARRPKRYAFGGGGGAFYCDGQISRNSAKTQQHVRFFNTRFANVDDYTFYINFINRVDFVACHTEFRGGSFLQDGVTANGPSFMFGRTITPNARAVSFISGDRSGEPDNITFYNATRRIVFESGLDDLLVSATKSAGRMLSGGQFRDRGLWTPTMTGGTTPGTPVFSTQVGTYTRYANFVYITGRLVCTSLGGMTGTVTIGGLPFAASELLSTTSGDGNVTFGVLSNVTFGSYLAGTIDEGTKNLLLIKCTSGGAVANIQHTDLTATFTIQFSGLYITEDA